MSNGNGAFLQRFLKQESAGGILLFCTALLAMLMANSPLAHIYSLFIETPVVIRIGALVIDKPLLLWVNDGLMAVFFFLVSLELKREVLEGELASPGNIVLPALGAVGGMVVPAAIYLYFNGQHADTVNGWAIPAATDIAFALGVLSLLGSRVPGSLKVFLTSLAIFDDIGAIVIIALFYTSKISVTALFLVVFCIVVLTTLNRRGVASISIYVSVGVVMWVAMLKSGVHATLAGVILAAFIPNQSPSDAGHSPLRGLERDLHATVAFVILPVFAFCNSGIQIAGIGMQQVLHSVPLGVALGLFAGKQLGVFVFCWGAIKLGYAKLPQAVSWPVLYGVAVLCGIGFTMSLFIGSLAFEASGVDQLFDERLGIVIGSLFSGVVGYLILRTCLPSKGPGEKV